MQLRVVGQFLEQLAAKFVVLIRSRGLTHSTITLFAGTLSDHRER
jgi:isochorismate synthase EntC